MTNDSESAPKVTSAAAMRRLLSELMAECPWGLLAWLISARFQPLSAKSSLKEHDPA